MPAGEPRTVFRTFVPEEFQRCPAWERLEPILQSNGGSFGLSGARGAGKTWLMQQAIHWARNGHGSDATRGIGLWYPTPSEYDPLAFIASLSDSLATEIERQYRGEPSGPHGSTLAVALALIVGVIVTGVLAILATTGFGLAQAVAIGLAASAAAAAPWPLWTAIRRQQRPEERLVSAALATRERARFSATRRESSELGAEGGRGVVARVQTARERELVERPATLSLLVNDFRALAKQTGEVAGRVVIAIDELDKMADPQKVRDLLRDIKGIFDVPGVHFLVSVSDEAARSLSLGALQGRDEFNSSFYTVIESKPAEPDQSASLLERRADVSRDVALALGVLGGGNPREVVRLAELTSSATTGAEATVRALQEEALRFRREVVTAPNDEHGQALGAEARTGVFAALPDKAFADPGEFAAFAQGILSERWEPGWGDDAWTDRFEEAWQRLLVRLAVGEQLVRVGTLVQDRELGLRLQDVVIAASQSARVGRVVLEEQLRLDPRTTDLSRYEARERLAKLARDYEQTRTHMAPGNLRTRSMDRIVASARELARAAQLTDRELQDLILSKEPGNRVIGLASVQATGHPQLFPYMLDAIIDPETPFEQYHALRALDSLRPHLTNAQRQTVRTTLSRDDVRRSWRGDASREHMAERLLTALGDDGSEPV